MKYYYCTLLKDIVMIHAWIFVNGMGYKNSVL